MHVDHQKKIIFIHNPKTAGRSIIKMIDFSHSDEMLPFVHLYSSTAKNRIFKELWDEYATFCFVRNPWDRYVSLYHFHRSIRYLHLHPSNHFPHEIARRYDFNDWMEYNNEASQKSRWFGVPQSAWWKDVKHVFKFEEMQKSIAQISLLANTELQEQSENVGAYKRESIELSKKSIDIIASIDEETISRFDYFHP